MSTRAFRVGLVLILALALVVRVALAERYEEIDPVTDALDYDRHAASIAEGHGYPVSMATGEPGGPSALRPPGYPYFLGAVYKLSGTDDVRKRWSYARAAQALLGTAVVGLLALIALQLWGRREALVAGGMAAVYPPLLLSGTALLTEPLFMMLALAGVAVILHYRGRDDRARWLILAGVLAGLAALTRANGVVLIAVLALGAWIVRPRLSWRSLAAPAIVAASAALVIAPWTIRNASELDAFVPVSTQAGFALIGQYNQYSAENRATWIAPWDAPHVEHLFFRDEPLGEVELERRLRERAIDYAIEHPAHIAASLFWNGLRYLHLPPGDALRDVEDEAAWSGEPPTLAKVSVFAFWALLPAMVLGAFTPAGRSIPLFVWITPALLVLSTVFVVALQRYGVPVDIFLILIATPAVVSTWDRLFGRPADVHDRAACGWLRD